MICANKIKVVETCGAAPDLMKKLHAQLRAGGVEVIIHKCVKVSQAKRAEETLGVDMISLMGFDSGGLPGEADTGLFVQLALAKKVLKIPFLASGGVATGSQLLAALALGAAGVQIGTRFNATVECSVFPQSFKKRMVSAGIRDTAVVMSPFNASSRVLLNAGMSPRARYVHGWLRSASCMLALRACSKQAVCRAPACCAHNSGARRRQQF